jgi:hypothetical protein
MLARYFTDREKHTYTMLHIGHRAYDTHCFYYVLTDRYPHVPLVALSMAARSGGPVKPF